MNIKEEVLNNSPEKATDYEEEESEESHNKSIIADSYQDMKQKGKLQDKFENDEREMNKFPKNNIPFDSKNSRNVFAYHDELFAILPFSSSITKVTLRLLSDEVDEN